MEAKADGAKVLAICAQHGEGNQASVDAIRADLGGNTLALEFLLDCACDSTLPGNGGLRESAALFLRYMSEDDDNKNKLATRDTLSRLVTVMAGDSASLQCKASCCSVVFNVCTQTKEKALMETIRGGGAGGALGGDGGEGGDGAGEGGEDDPGFDPPAGAGDGGDGVGGGGGGGEGGGVSADPLSATGASVSFSEMPTINAAMGGSMLTGGFGDEPPPPSSAELQRLEMVIEAGGIHPLVVLCAGPGGFDAKPAADAGGGGKKGKKKGGKKKKEPPVTPEMAEAQLAAAGVLRRMTVRSDWAAAVVRAEGARLLMPLMAAKSDQTRWHATAALWNMSGDSANNEALNEQKAPGFLTNVVPYKGDKTGVFLTRQTSTRNKEDARPTTAP